MPTKDGIIPTWATFRVPGKVLFKMYRDGRFILEEGDYDFFRREIIDPTLDSALQPVRDFKKARIHLVDIEGVTEKTGITGIELPS